jgi:hypothetical protein
MFCLYEFDDHLCIISRDFDCILTKLFIFVIYVCVDGHICSIYCWRAYLNFPTMLECEKMAHSLDKKNILTRVRCHKNIFFIRIDWMLLMGFGFMVFNATFNNISVISWRSVLLVEEITITMQYSFFPSAIRTWNTLPQQLASMTSLECFRQALANTTIVP